METVLKAISDWIKSLLTAAIMSNLSGLFDDVNAQVGGIAQQVGTKPSSFEPRVFAMIEALSRNVVLPIAGVILTFIACYELIQMITQHNNMAQFEPALILKWIFKTAISVWMISNTFDIIMAVFDVTQQVVANSSGIISGNTRVNDIGLSMLQSSMMQMDVGPLFGLFLQSFFIGITMRILSIVIFVIVYGRMIEIYMMVSLAPVPMATWGNHEQSHVGQNYLRSLFALGFQGFLILICVAIYAVLLQNVAISGDNYVTESTFDAYLYQTLENKQKFISQIMTSKSPMRSCDDIDEQALSYAEIKALCAGDPRIREKMDLDVQVAKLKVLRGDFQNQKYRLEDKLLKTFPEEIQKQKTRIAALQQDSQIAAAHPQDKENFCGMTIKGMVYDDKKAAGERLLLARQEMPNADMMLLGTYRGFELNIRFDSFKNEHQAVLRAELSYPVSLGDDARGNITRLDNAIDNFADRIADAENALQNLEQQKQAAEVEVAKPFAQEEELAEKSARLAELNALLNIDRDRSSSQDAPEETEETETPTTRPSVLAALGEKTNQPEPVKPFRSYYDKDGDAR